MKLLKQIKTDFGQNVKYYELGASKSTLKIYSFTGQEMCNNRVLKVTNFRGNITEERYHSFIGREFRTDLEVVKYYTRNL